MACVRPFGIYYGLCETLWNILWPVWDPLESQFPWISKLCIWKYLAIQQDILIIIVIIIMVMMNILVSCM